MIPELPKSYVEHLVSPRGPCDLPAAEAAGQVGSMVGGMGVRVTLAWRAGGDGEAHIRDVGVRVFGSAAPVAPASCLAGLAIGLTPTTAQALEADALIESLLGGEDDVLPATVHKGARFVVDALHCALGLPRCRPADPQGPGVLVCRCLDVGDRQIRDAIARGAATPEAVAARCGACTGCGSCRSDVLVLIQEELRSATPPPPATAHPVARIALARVGPVLAAHGLPLCDVDVTNGVVHLHLGTPTADASMSPQGAREIAHQMLRETVASDIDVRV